MITIEFTNEEVELLKDALEHLPSKDLAGEMLSDIMIMVLSDNKDKAKESLRQQEIKKEQKKPLKELVKQQCEALKAKLILKQAQTQN